MLEADLSLYCTLFNSVFFGPTRGAPMGIYPRPPCTAVPVGPDYLHATRTGSAKKGRLHRVHELMNYPLPLFSLQKFFAPGIVSATMTELELTTDIREEDYEPLFLIDYKCFYNFPEIARAFFPGGLDPAQREANVESMKIGVFGGPNRAYAKITSLSNNGSDIAAFISCHIYRGPRGLLDDTSDLTKTTLPRVENPEDRAFYEWYWDTVRGKLRDMEEFQVPHVSIQAIATDPKWQRHGAGAMMMSWCIDLARKEGIGRCALYAGPFAAEIGFYEKFGFQRGATMTFTDEDRFPGRVGTPEVVMWRDV